MNNTQRFSSHFISLYYSFGNSFNINGQIISLSLLFKLIVVWNSLHDLRCAWRNCKVHRWILRKLLNHEGGCVKLIITVVMSLPHWYIETINLSSESWQRLSDLSQLVLQNLPHWIPSPKFLFDFNIDYRAIIGGSYLSNGT